MPVLTPKQINQLNLIAPGPKRYGVGVGTILQQVLKNQQVKLEGFAGAIATGNALVHNLDTLVFTTNDTPANFITAVDNSNFYKGTGSNKLKSLTTAVAGDKTSVTIGSVDWSASDRIGFWAFSDIAMSAGDLQLYIYGGSDQFVNVPAIPAGIWKWIEVDISSVTGLATVTKYGFKRNVAKAFNVNIDFFTRYKSTSLSTLSQVPAGLVQLSQILTANTGTHTFASLVEDTDYILGSDSKLIIYLTNQSANSIMAYYSL